MTNNRKLLLGSVMAAALGTALLYGAPASAQDYDNDGGMYQASPGESVIVHPSRHPLGVILRDGRIAGARSGSLYNDEQLSLSEAVDYSDLDMARGSDRHELQLRIRDTAQNICATLDAQDRFHSNFDARQQCVRTAISEAQSQIPAG